ncbi:MAG: hypothetical protein WAK91_13500 [Candidatus Acidiferrales bacterium]|jgi:hypothetical protein
MGTRFWTTSSAIFILAAFGASAQQSQSTQAAPPPGQQSNVVSATTPQAPSIADAARKAREQRKSEPKSGKVFTNDNLPAEGGINVVGDATAPMPAGGTPAQAAITEKIWRDRFAAARAQLQRDQADLDLMQRELGKLNVQYYPSDPTKQLMQSVTNSDINDKRAKIAEKQQKIRQDEGDISVLEDQLRKSGGDPGWAR